MFFKEILMFKRKKFLDLKCYLRKVIVFSVNKVNIKITQRYRHEIYPNTSLFQGVLNIFNKNVQLIFVYIVKLL